MLLLVPLPDVQREPFRNGSAWLHPRHLVVVPEKLEKRGPRRASFSFWLLEGMERRAACARYDVQNRSFSSGSCNMVTFFFGAALLFAAFENLSKEKPQNSEKRMRATKNYRSETLKGALLPLAEGAIGTRLEGRTTPHNCLNFHGFVQPFPIVRITKTWLSA